MSEYYSLKSSVENKEIPVISEIPEKPEIPKIGNCLDDFFIQSILSIKEKNFVAKVKSKLNNQIYIMKRIDKNKAEEIKKDEYISRENEFLKLLDHENIVDYITSFEDSQFLYIITEYVENGDLLMMINSQKRSKAFRIEEEKLMKIFLQCLRALSYIHSCGIIFRALKPDKILIDNENNIKITNFKYAAIDNENIAKKRFSNITEEKLKKLKNKFEIIDSRPYQPPEMKKGGIYDKKIDVYSLGMIFCHLAYLDLEIPKKNKYSKELSNFIKKMIEINPSKRSTSEEAYKELKNIYLKKYSHNTGINSCLRCLSSLPDINYDFLNLLIDENKKGNYPILRNLINFLVIINNIKQTYLNSKEDFSQKIEEELNIAVYNFLEELNNRGCINLNEYKEFSLKDFLFILFYLLELELELNWLNVDVNLQNILNEKINKEFENKEEGKIKQLLTYFNVRSIFSENLSIITKTHLQCMNCKRDIVESYKKNYFISFNVEKIKNLNKDKLNIMNAFESLDKNVIKGEYCQYCKKKTEFKSKIGGIYNTSKDLIILFDRGENCKHKDLIDFDMVLNLDRKNIELMRLHKEKYSYELYGVIIRKEKYDPSNKNKKTEEFVYYTRDIDENFFTRKDRKVTYNLTQVKSEGDVMGLFYYCKELEIKKDNNKPNLNCNNNINNIQAINENNQNINTSVALKNPININPNINSKNIVINNIPDNNLNNIRNMNTINNNEQNMNKFNNNNQNMNIINDNNQNININNNMNLNNNNMNLNNNIPNVNLNNNNMNLINNIPNVNLNNQNMNINNMNLNNNIPNVNLTLIRTKNSNNEINFMNNLMTNNKFNNNNMNNNQFNMNNNQINNLQPNNNLSNMNNQFSINFMMNNEQKFNNPNNNNNFNQNNFVPNSNNADNNYNWNNQMNMHNNNIPQNFNDNNNNFNNNQFMNNNNGFNQ